MKVKNAVLTSLGYLQQRNAKKSKKSMKRVKTYKNNKSHKKPRLNPFSLLSLSLSFSLSLSLSLSLSRKCSFGKTTWQVKLTPTPGLPVAFLGPKLTLPCKISLEKNSSVTYCKFCKPCCYYIIFHLHIKNDFE